MDAVLACADYCEHLAVSPRRALRPCLVHGCPIVVESGRCAQHQHVHQQQDIAHRGNERERGYTAAVRRAMEEYRHAHPWCEPCLTWGERVPTEIVDHMRALRDGGSPLGPFESMCRPHHGFKTAAEQRARVVQ